MKNIFRIVRYIIGGVVVLYDISLFIRVFCSFLNNELDLNGLLVLYVLLIFILACGWLIWPRNKSLIKFNKKNVQGVIMTKEDAKSTSYDKPECVDAALVNHIPVLKEEFSEEEKDEVLGDLCFVLELKNKIKQLLETIYILENTSNIDILIGRYQFFIKTISVLSKYKLDARYVRYLSEGVDLYKTLYYDKPVTDTQMKFVVNPEYSQYLDFYCANVIRCFNAFCDKMDQQMASVKTQAAKDRRKGKILEISNICKTELILYDMNTYIIQIELRSNIYM